MMSCPTDDDLARLVDGALSWEETERSREHLARCARCRDREDMLRILIADVKVAVPAQVDVRAHTRAVMGRLDRPLVEGANPPRAWWWMAAAAAGVLLVVGYRGVHRPSAIDTWQARGGHVAPAIGRDVGVQPYAVEGGLHPLVSGSTIDAATPITAGFRNLGKTPAFLLLFGVDAHRVVHWISPRFARPEDDPVSTTLRASASERVLDETVVFEDVSAGPLRVIAVITSSPAHVSDVESLAGTDLSPSRLTSRLPGAEIRETIVDVRDARGSR
jgi:hypothetical protein